MRFCLFPLLLKPRIENTEELYYRGKSTRIVDREPVSFDTYFNQLSVKKYREYTGLDSFILVLRLRGRGKVGLWGSMSGRPDRILLTRDFFFPREDTLELQITPKVSRAFDSVWFSVCTDDSCELLGGRYEAETDREPETVRLGIVICTYRREEYVLRNLRTLAEYADSDDAWHDSFELFCVDNANTLTADKVCLNSRFHLITNKNYGGSGGFARGLMELTAPGASFTHAYFMDDDIVFEPSVLQRILSLFSFIREPYRNAFLPLGMLDLNEPTVQCENTARYSGTTFWSNKGRLDLSEKSSFPRNEADTSADYAGWWSVVFPLKEIGPDNLPLPFFIKLDDTEFGLRLMEQSVTLNGLGVWHAGFSGKSAAWQEYYVARNGLILLALYPERLKTDPKAYLSVRLIKSLSAGSLQSMQAVEKGVTDYVRGAEWLMSCRPDELHRELLSSLQEKTVYPGSSIKKVFRAALHLLTPTGIRILKAYFRCVSVVRQKRDISRTYQENRTRMISRDFWIGYLG